MTTRGVIAIAGENLKRIIGETMIRKMWRDIILHAMMTEIEITNNTENNKNDRKHCNPRDMWVHHQKVFQNHPNTIETVTDTTRVNLHILKEMRIKVATFRTKLTRRRMSNQSLNTILRKRKITRSRKINVIIKKHRLTRVAST
jgi:hypothetical protein